MHQPPQQPPQGPPVMSLPVMKQEREISPAEENGDKMDTN
jgi:hypothetical protein